MPDAGFQPRTESAYRGAMGYRAAPHERKNTPLGAALTTAAAAALALSACGTGEDPSAQPNGDSPSEADISSSGGVVPAMDAADLPDSPPELEAPEPATVITSASVLEDAEGPQLCYYMMESYPPQCGGPDVIGWDWDEHPHNEASGVRWGDYVLTGDYDPGTEEFTLDEVLPDDEAPAAPDISVDFTSPCPEPEGGWEVEDPERTTDETLQQTQQSAEQLPGYAGLWVDNSPNPVTAEDVNEAAAEGEDTLELEEQLNDPELLILNVQVTEDPQGAYNTLREQWGGMLCISEATFTEDELNSLQEELEVPGANSLSVDTTSNQLSVQVLYDDGTLQSQIDEHYGPGVVVINSAMQPQD
ncbi:hypothetical protein [Nesterenkonia ebinurensis]|uniref:hypothetical protein n=1 Tax=Nesterenkonia ebinurensis TaxID=2608252 RepID=UPI00123CC367|nr:hypothetical protein [Nesterenkonia ebinurensis]